MIERSPDEHCVNFAPEPLKSIEEIARDAEKLLKAERHQGDFKVKERIYKYLDF